MVRSALFTMLLSTTLAADAQASGQRSYADVAAGVQPKMVKIFGSGGLQGLESYQSGFLISPDGLILTAWSYVLDTGEVTVILNDGRKLMAETIGADPRTEIAIVKVEAADLPHFVLGEARALLSGQRVLAFSNLYGVATGDEPTSVLHGLVSGITKLSARRGVFQTPYQGDVYVLDAMTNNAGAAGGALTDARGNLAGVLGKELRDSSTNTWLNYALPIGSLTSVVEDIVAGREVRNPEADELPEESADLTALGIVLIPDVLSRTPPFVDQVRPYSSAAKAGLKPDDLIVLIGGSTVSSQAAVREALTHIDSVDAVSITVVRGMELMEFNLQP